jgi:two-component system sensor histidine kinase YesM
LGGISGAAVIKDYASNEIKGLLIVVIKDNYFRNMQYSNQNLENVFLYLISPDKSIIIPMNSSENEIEEDILKQIDGQEKRGSFTGEKTNYTDEYLVSYIKNNAMGWYLVSVSTASSLTATFNRTASILLVTLAISLLACFFLASGISGYVTKGMRALADKMRKVGQGDFNAKINTGRIDEIGELSNVFDNMVENTKSLIKQKYEQELLKKEAEYRALQAQINPHFLHNTLDMINWRLIDKGEEEISQSIVALGNLLRYSAENDSPNAHIHEEISNVKDYLFLRHANSKKMFEYEIEVDDSMDIVIPKLTLQPIVENSLIYGFAGRKMGNKIQIYGSIKKEGYIIEIADNGIGMTEEKIEKIKSSKSQTPSNEKSHIGLKNVEARIKHMYKDAKFDILSQYGFGTTIRIFIPKVIG